ncbi:hypothetical protein HK104_006209 [Borealophlyctis nickersoniae]|nr:hypothetical protein HK104_006209 [Borealophlyctis nickersoniae]
MLPQRTFLRHCPGPLLQPCIRRRLNHSLPPAYDSWAASVRSKTLKEADHITASPVQLLTTTLNPDAPLPPLPQQGTPLPPAYHFGFFPHRVPEKGLAPDGYDVDFSPPEPFNVRMWSGGSIEWNVDNPLKVGQNAKMVTSLDKVEKKTTARGDAVFVAVKKNVENEDGWSMTEIRSLVYLQREKERTKAVVDSGGTKREFKCKKAFFNEDQTDSFSKI